MRYKLFFKWREIELEWMIERINFLKYCVKNAVEDVVYSIDDDFFVQYSYQSNSFFHHVRSIEEFTMFYVLKTNIPNWTKVIFENVNLVKLNVILYVIHNFYDATSYEWTFVIVIQMKMNAFMNKSNKRTLIKSTSQVNIFTKASFFVRIIKIYKFYAKRMSSKIDWIYVYKIKFTNEKKLQNFEQKIIEFHFDCVIIDEVHVIRISNSDFQNVLDRMKRNKFQYRMQCYSMFKIIIFINFINIQTTMRFINNKF